MVKVLQSMVSAGGHLQGLAHVVLLPYPPPEDTPMTGHVHSSHPEILRRLQRAAGHLERVIGMIREQRECPEIAQQLHAVEKAIGNAKRELVHDHLDHCLDHAVEDGPKRSRAAIQEFKDITKYL
jgi:DNA-binding FrmR family transcriptional regulator